ncbi:GNAT family N-acetyltransferase [Niallia sp. XMNu-256]|uniref:GNAT family N-acetyltransferase n=1 Tax=Niallia sp. XMNu-256 TaxID=3082444 RepID=UPI0030D54316
MKLKTVNQWDDEVWKKWRVIYHEAFGNSGGKQEKVIKNMLNKKISHFHYIVDNEKIFAIALTGILKNSKMLLIDYLAVSKEVRYQGVGKKLVHEIKKWAQLRGFSGILIEVEAEQTVTNAVRIQFWKKCGFIETSYVHDYKVVKELYKTMYISFYPFIKIQNYPKKRRISSYY